MSVGVFNLDIKGNKWDLDREKCIKCGACVAVCPFTALELPEFPEVNEKCIFCNICAMACPVDAIKVTKTNKASVVEKSTKDISTLSKM